DQSSADEMADKVLTAFMAMENEFDCRLLSPVEAIREAKIVNCKKPVVLADVQDNPGAGGTSDTTGLLAALISEEAKNAVLGLMCDPEMARLAHQAGTGKIICGSIGAKSGTPDQFPIVGSFLVEKLDEGNCRFTGEMYGGGLAVLGRSAVLKIISGESDIRIVVTSQRSQCLDLGLFTHFGIEPQNFAIVCVKSTVHFRADFEPIASRVINVATPGAFVCELDKIPYQHLPKMVKRGPASKQK
ncbi:MAG: MlrC C-terminal domain-containing protein, partial [Salaquimonas sp.]